MSNAWPYDPYYEDPSNPYAMLDQPTAYSDQGWPINPYSKQWWEVNHPMTDRDVMSRTTRASGFGQDGDDFDMDILARANPNIRSWAIEALGEGRSGTDALAYLQQEDVMARMRDDIGRTAWDEYGRSNPGRDFKNLDGKGKDKVVQDHYLEELEKLIFAGSPSGSNQLQRMDYFGEYFGGRPPPGAGAAGAPPWLEELDADSDFVRGGGYVGPEAGERQQPNLLAQLKDDELEALVGNKGAQAQSLRQFDPQRTSSGLNRGSAQGRSNMTNLLQRLVQRSGGDFRRGRSNRQISSLWGRDRRSSGRSSSASGRSSSGRSSSRGRSNVSSRSRQRARETAPWLGYR
jgi:hypothetical protein